MNSQFVTERVKEIQAIAERLRPSVPGIDALAARAIEGGASVAEFRDEAMQRLPELAPMQRPKPLDVKPQELMRYSLSRAIKGQIDSKMDGIERELDQEVRRRLGRSAEGFWVPGQAFLNRNFIAGTGTLGGMIVSTPTDGSQFIELLRNRAKVIALGARILNLDSPVQIPRQAGTGDTNWVGETVAATLSTGNFEQITLTPKGVSGFQQYGKQLLVTSNPSIDMLIRDDINASIGLAVDKAALHGTGGLQPVGLAGTAGVNTVALAANAQALGNATAYPAMVSLETLISSDNADAASMAYLMNAAARGALKGVPRFANTDTPVWENNQVNGYRAEVTQQVATNLTTGTATTICTAVFFGDWKQLIIAQFNGGATDLVVDPFTLAANGVVRIIARRWVDIAVRHPEGFAILGGIL
jgi:HK97 family phage major capsid protein